MLNLITKTNTAKRLMLANWTTAHSFQKESPLSQTASSPMAQNHESPECAKKTAILRNVPGRSATRS
jgi:hypothetical protein